MSDKEVIKGILIMLLAVAIASGIGLWCITPGMTTWWARRMTKKMDHNKIRKKAIVYTVATIIAFAVIAFTVVYLVNKYGPHVVVFGLMAVASLFLIRMMYEMWYTEILYKEEKERDKSGWDWDK